jgi:dipeptidyl aminopeptidase/acylaminoacyl peptidase
MKPFSAEDLYLHQRVSEASCLPGSEIVAFTVRSIDKEQGKYVSCIWSCDLTNGETRQLSRGPGQDHSPSWAPDASALAFLSDRRGAPQVYLLPKNGGEARQVGAFKESVMSLHWLPNGKSLLVTSAVKVDPDDRGARARIVETNKPRQSPAEVAWRLPYKEDGIGYLLQREIHLFRLDVITGQATQLTDGTFDVLAFDVAPDGERIAYSRSREGRFAHCSDLWVSQVDGASPQRLTHRHAIVMAPKWSPDGTKIAFTGALQEGDAEPRLWILDVATKDVAELCGETVDVADSTSVRWEGNHRLVFVRAHRGRHQIVCLDTSEQDITVLQGKDRQLSAFGCTGSNFVYCVDHPSLPSELWAQPRRGGKERQLSRLNRWWDDRIGVTAEIRDFDVPDGKGGVEKIEGWLLRGANGSTAGRLLNDVHGGPASYALLDFDTNVFWQVLCSQGWAVLALNAVGSSSYGREFCQRLAGHWGEYDLPQHLAAIEQLQGEGIGRERVTISGKSYGGFLSAWATGHTDLFSAAVVMAPVGNIETHYGTSDGGYYADPFYVASAPRFDRELARALSPLQHIEKSTTPTLFMQGKEDERCPKCQSEELFVSLMRAGDTPAELVLYPGQTHSFLGSGTPSCREDAARRIMDWLSHPTWGSSPEDGGPFRVERAAESEAAAMSGG